MAKAPLGTVLALLLSGAAAGQQTAELSARLLDPFAFRHIGPIGNRVSAVAGVPGDEGVYYAGAASGGLWRTHNGGVDWEPIFDRQEAASIGSIAVAPSDPNVIWVGTGESFIRSNISIGNGVYRSTDRGDSFEHLGLDRTGRVGRIVVHPDDPGTALIAALGHAYGPQEQGEAGRGVFRTTDGGTTWEHALFLNLITRPLYYTRMAAAPDRADEVTFVATRLSVSLDGGSTVASEGFEQAGWDHHDIWIDPLDPDRRIVGHDGGVSITTDRGRTWYRPQLPIAQMYHVSTDDLRSGQARDVSVWPLAIESSPASALEYRFQWTAPFATSPHDEAVYAGSQYVHRSRDRGQSWERISPDLTTADPALMRRTGGLTLDDAGPTIAPVIFAIAESPLEPGLIWAGTNDGQVQLTRDGRESWTNVTANLPALPPLGTVRNIDPSDFDAGTAYVAIDRHQEGDTTPYVFRTNDYGETWTDLAANLPRGPLGNVHCIREDPEQAGLLFLGAENALWVSFDDGADWQRLSRRSDGGANLPPAPVHWIEVQEHFDDLVVATYGRGIWILDDVTPLRAIARGLSTDGPELLPPRVTYRFRTRGAPMAQPDVPATGTNPPYGALLHYWLPDPGNAGVSPASGAERRAADARGQIRIFNEQEELVRTLDDLPAESGFHRATWDLRHEPTTEVRLRTKPDERPDWKMPAEGWRPLPDGGRLSLVGAPGVYRLDLSLPGDAGEDDDEDEALSTTAFEVLLDPDATASADDLAAQNELLFAIRDAIERAASILNGAEDLRSQLPALRERLEATLAGPLADLNRTLADAGFLVLDPR